MAPSRRDFLALTIGALAGGAKASHAQSSKSVLFRNVRIFDGTGSALSPPSDVLVTGNTIARISADPISEAGAAIIDGNGRTLMPGLIDAHVHMVMSTLPISLMMTSDPNYSMLRTGKAATDMLMRGFTSVRDLGGPTFGLKRAIDEGFIAGPRIWPSGATISQTSGHGDFRTVLDLPQSDDAPPHFTERLGFTAIADGVPQVLRRAREQLMQGASQIKLMAGGGVASSFDPLDVTQFTEEEIHAAVQAAGNWGTYVTVHAYTPDAVQTAIRAGVRCIDHGQMLDEESVKIMADKGIWWSLQPFTDDGPSAFPEGSPNRIKQLEMYGGTDKAYALGKKYQVKIAWGTDILFDQKAAAKQGHQLAKMTRWFTSSETLEMATASNAQLLAFSGNRNPYPGQLGTIQEGALADLLLIDGDPLSDIELLEEPEKTLVVIMKDGKIHKNTSSG
ncbi:amidohydrolase family protein [Aestuariivirga sp.]|uniref:metal-dependent hydrolase family protein n=1 Tax=Aestuariivirga sp. TaxID=2650926 RepID=UPI0035937353